MAIRDLGYRPYEGARLPASHNTWVLLRHGARRAWGSWLVKLAVFGGFLPALFAVAAVGIAFWFGQQMGEGGPRGDLVEAPKMMRLLFDVQLWLFLTMITLGAGAGAIAEDLTYRAFQFYFAKPVTPEQYLSGRVAAVAIYCVVFTFLPALLVITTVVATALPEARLEKAGLVLPALLLSLVIGPVLAVASVAVSSLSKSRALTMSAWLLILIVPHVIASIVAGIGEWPWLKLTSLPALLGVVGDAFFKIEREDALRWYHAAPVLAGVVVAGVALALYRLRRAEVIT